MEAIWPNRLPIFLCEGPERSDTRNLIVCQRLDFGTLVPLVLPLPLLPKRPEDKDNLYHDGNSQGKVTEYEFR